MNNQNNTYHACCAKSECGKANECLRYKKYVESESLEALYIINNLYTRVDSDCPYYISHTPVECGRGFVQLLDSMPSAKVDAFRRAMQQRYARNRYFLLRRGEELCWPDDKQFIVETLRDLDALPAGYDGTPASLFDAVEQRILW